jgi:hypothetical protein
MIELKVEEYCNECPNFEADVKELRAIEFVGQVPIPNFMVMCAHRNRCSAMKRYLEKTLKKEN